MDVLSAIGILSDAWKAVTVDTIRNCFHHAGFVLDDEDSATGHDPAAELPPDTNIIDDLRASGVDIPAVTFEQFANFDSAVLPCADLDDEEIVRQVLEPPQVDSDSDDDAPPTPQPSSADLAQALTTLFSVYSDSQTLSEIQADLIARKRAPVQSVTHLVVPVPAHGEDGWRDMVAGGQLMQAHTLVQALEPLPGSTAKHNSRTITTLPQVLLTVHSHSGDWRFTELNGCQAHIARVFLTPRRNPGTIKSSPLLCLYTLTCDWFRDYESD
ncbi:hypothetical protein HPB49_004161 [Dermacentor silvarum]|uniref:Uncharacterized protein n=1 Tax=Dermacentor silvarum TaxID=543639 RepID=A0ACB8CPN0_DERSI|nr:hypothetical protein HPB49_004161 [Dermacentor silvarum]